VRGGQRRKLPCMGLSETPNPTHPPHPRQYFFLGMEPSKLFIGVWSWSNPRCGLLGLVGIN